MVRRSSRALETRRSASGTHSQSARAAKRGGKAGSITGASSGNPRPAWTFVLFLVARPFLSNSGLQCSFFLPPCTPYLYPPQSLLLIQHIYSFIRTIHQARTHARANTLTPYPTVLAHSHSPLTFSLPHLDLCSSFPSFPFPFLSPYYRFVFTHI